MKTHKVLTDSIEKACHSILIENNHASYVIQQSLLEGKRWGSRDRRFIAETVSLVVKNYRKLCFLTGQTFGEVVNFPPIVALAIYLEYNEMADVYKDLIDVDVVAKLQLLNKKVKTLPDIEQLQICRIIIANNH